MTPYEQIIEKKITESKKCFECTKQKTCSLFWAVEAALCEKSIDFGFAADLHFLIAEKCLNFKKY